ncbi:MAG: sugar phosphate isomerase/epimerase [Kordiimonadaceae bacterium]|nr:sugar phosphate isomerase/epimerase [Kordiimonadaceae bacterium]
MKQIKGPALFLAQFLGKNPPFNSLEAITAWAADLGYKGVQIPTSDKHIFDLELAAESQDYCDIIVGTCANAGVVITELSTHLQGQLVACHAAYADQFAAFAPPELKGHPVETAEWAKNQLLFAAKASARLNLASHATFSGALAWHTMYPWPQRPQGMIDDAFAELGRRWTPILNAFDEAGVDVCYELHPGEDLFDGVTFERFLDQVNGHTRANILYDPSHLHLQQIKYLDFIDIYHDRIKAFHVKDAEFQPTGKSGLYGGYQNWIERPGRFRSLGDGQIDFKAIFSKLTQYDFDGWAVVEWECCIKHPEDGAREGADFVKRHIIRPAEYAFDDFTQG